MNEKHGIAEHWAQGDVMGRILAAMEQAGIDPDALDVDILAPLDHFHARGLAATEDLAAILPVRKGDRILDIGCGIGGPARYLARRFGCHVSGIDITPAFVEAGQRLTGMLGMEDSVEIALGDGERLPYADRSFDGAISQHVTMNVADRDAFFGEAFRVLRPGGFFALTEHGLGAAGAPHHPLPWSEDGTGAHLVTPAQTVAHLEKAGFTGISVTDTGDKYLAGYLRAMELAETGALPVFGSQVLLGRAAPEKTRNAARNIEEGRTHPIQVLCHRPR